MLTLERADFLGKCYVYSKFKEVSELSDELSELDKQITRVQLVGLPGWVAIGLGLYGFLSEGDAFISPLNNDSFCIAIVLIGAYIAIWEFRKILPLFKQRKKLDR